jgi:hypothetical protein
MKGRLWNHRWLVLLFAALPGVLGQPSLSRAQSDPFHNSLMTDPEKKTEYGVGDGVFDEKPVPYKGQIYCPVTGVKLGLNGPAQEVQTSLGEQKPTGFKKMMGAKPKPGVLIFVCCPECAKKVKANPQPYFVEIVADKAVFTFGYESAPNQRPERPKGKPRDPEPTQPAPETAATEAPSIRPLSGDAPPPPGR